MAEAKTTPKAVKKKATKTSEPSFYEKVADIQKSLHAPKGQRNNFGKYNYRSAEDILQAVKPHLNGLILNISDDLVLVGDRYYVKSTASISDGTNTINVSAFAREQSDKKGMDQSQITGSTSSYARKYALNGLFAIDDTKDADTNEQHNEVKETPIEVVGVAQVKVIRDLISKLPDGNDYKDESGVARWVKVKTLEEIPLVQYEKLEKALNSLLRISPKEAA